MVFLRWVAALSFLVLGILSVSYLQKKFDDGDLRKALQAVRLKAPDAGDCRAEVVSRLRGVVQVRCRETAWKVDVVRGVIEKIDQ